MTRHDLINLVIHNLKRMRTRVLMTALGVCIGTAAVVVLVSLGAGLARQTRESLMSGGGLADLQVNAPSNFSIQAERPPGAALEPERSSQRGTHALVLDKRTLDEIRAISNVEDVFVSEMLMAQSRFSYGKLTGYPTVIGLDPEVIAKLGLSASSGTTDIHRGQVIIGARVAEYTLRDPDQFDPYQQASPGDAMAVPDLLGETLHMQLARLADDSTMVEKTARLEVVGLLEPSGWRYDYAIIMPIRDVIEFNTWSQGKRRDPERQGYTQAIVRAVDVQHTLDVATALEEMGFSVHSEQQQVEQTEAYFATVQAVLGGIGGVALLVSAFGIANTMSMAIYERTREIGLMKAIGATRSDIMRIFLYESGGIGFLGGLGGDILGVIVTLVINLIVRAVRADQMMNADMLDIAYTPLWLPIFALVFAIVIGIASGAFPANRAANLEPLSALKYE